MMVLHPGAAEKQQQQQQPPTSSSPSNKSSSGGNSNMQKTPLRRRRSKGTIAGYGVDNGGGTSNAKAGTSGGASSSRDLGRDNSSGGDSTSSDTDTSGPERPPSQSMASSQRLENTSGTGSNNASATSGSAKALTPAKPCHAARLALVCAQNVLRLGALTHLQLVPPGRGRRELQEKLRQRRRAALASRRVTMPASSAASDTYYALDKMVGTDMLYDYEHQEENYLARSDVLMDVDSDDASSGDDELFYGVDEMFSEDSSALDDMDSYADLNEPLFTPAGQEAVSNPNGAPMAGHHPATGRMAFARRKMRFFDAVTPQESAQARQYVQQELRRSKRRAGLLVTRHLRRLQRDALRRKRLERGEPIDDLIKETEADRKEEQALKNAGLSRLEAPMTPSLAVALLTESLCASSLESVDGMAKCYDAIVAAGTALLDTESLGLHPTDVVAKSRPSRSDVMAALAPHLITSLEHPAGETILLLAKMRRMCGTPRYQRRFVQRIAPCLIRPPHGAMWCLRHQNDMEAIMAAAELLFDSSFQVFSKGWYDRGRLILADSKRAETLKTAAQQLRDLSSDNTEGLGLTVAGGGRRRAMVQKKKDYPGGDHLAEWEVIAVDRQIRVSLSNALKMDWSRTAIQSDATRATAYRRATSGGMKQRGANVVASTASESPKSMASAASPRSPARSGLPAPYSKTPHSPPHMPSMAGSAPEAMENVFGPAFSGQLPPTDRAMSPPPPMRPTSPPMSKKQRESSMSASDTGSESNLHTISTPPRSPRSPKRTEMTASEAPTIRLPESGPTTTQLSPATRQRSGASSKSSIQSTIGPYPLSPSSVGTSASAEMVSYRPASAAAAAAAGGGPTAHYRTLTSTASERKRTVAACRALRAQISRFEDAFIQLHGRPPKGAAERAPLATTYAQYREWKRAIRADAACRIQALIRGSSTRWKLLRMNNPAMSRVVTRRAGRSGERTPDLSIPADIGQPSVAATDPDRSNAVSSISSLERPASGSTPTGSSWAGMGLRPRTTSTGDRALENMNSTPLPRSNSARATAYAPPSPSELSRMSLSELQARKRELKAELKDYDIRFASRHGRMPVKAEKEPIRHLYESYNALKSQISRMELEHRQQMPPVPMAVSPPNHNRSTSSMSNTTEGSTSGSEDAGSRSSPLPARVKQRRIPAAPSPPTSSSSQGTVPSTSSNTSTQDLAALKAEKSRLHQMLRSYERDFFRDNQRQVSSFADIRPVAEQYRRYKEIKKLIARMQQPGES